MVSHSNIAASQFLLEIAFWCFLPVPLSLHARGMIKHYFEGQGDDGEDTCCAKFYTQSFSKCPCLPVWIQKTKEGVGG